MNRPFSICFALAAVLSACGGDDAPIASAGADQTARIGDRVVLDGTASTMASDGSISYAWSLLESPRADIRASGSSSSLVFMPTWTGRFVFQLTASNEEGSTSDTVNLDVECGTEQTKSAFTETSSIWTQVFDPPECVDYRVTGDVRVPVGFVLTIAPGLNIAVEPSVVFGTNGGQFVAGGTEAEPIHIHGTTVGRGTWRGLSFVDSVTALLQFTTVEGGGGGDNPKGNIVTSGAPSLSVQNSTIKESAGYGIVFGFDTGIAGLLNNNITQNREGPVQVHLRNVRDLDESTTSYSGNDKDYVRVVGNSLNLDSTFGAIDVPYLLGEAGSNVVTFIRETGFNPGATLAFIDGVGLQVRTSLPFRAQGVTGLPITFRGESTSPGSWRGISFTEGANATLEGVVIENGGGGDPWTEAQGMNDRANVSVLASTGTTSVTLSGVTLSGSPHNAIWIEDADHVSVMCSSITTDDPIEPSCPFSR